MIAVIIEEIVGIDMGPGRIMAELLYTC